MTQHKDDKQTIEQPQKQKKPNGWFKPFVSGVVGGTLALGVYVLTPYAQHSSDSTANDSAAKTEAVSTNHTNSSKTTAVQTSNSSSSISSMVENVSPAIVGITNYQTQTDTSFGDFNTPFDESQQNKSSQEEETGTGSGVIFKKSGNKAYVLTNNHVIEGANKLTVSLHDGKTIEGKLVGADPLTDLAVVEISSSHVTKVAALGNSSSLRAGETVIAIGNPLGEDLSRTVTQGIVSGVDRTVSMNTSAGESSINVIQTDAAINPGNSGGPLLTTDGKVVGITSMKISETGVEGIGFALPINDVKPIADQLLAKGKIERPYIGISMLDLEQVPNVYQKETLGLKTSQLNQGVYVKDIAAGSPAAKAGLKSEDVITGINGKQIKTGSELRHELYTNAKVGDTVSITLIRNGKQETKQVTLTQSESKQVSS
ncbi:trypsin-like peptidase domain-containing protein [Bacillus safensis]|uniref:S1C family serine protease n=1 Tax=Bacillus TaxID=1386 RepID=UPI000C7819CE|nr:trypsin-like peptidase domain-containing protein [Bacillus safensis]MCM2985539.1 trypsin-like peptidase domain-containing protein [Bacillus safensis]MCY7446745.1 trypsin-like peptidase domain-containing protein [Bacillus safensis]MCY7457488.1 trypsin-like peptidase domain-containing protein [Bacillus safensis]MDP4564123.1 trypsin-like peptidase domain-containing protein [Bacillus safensis]PLT36830.1 serine protease [Bacillus safensis]